MEFGRSRADGPIGLALEPAKRSLSRGLLRPPGLALLVAWASCLAMASCDAAAPVELAESFDLSSSETGQTYRIRAYCPDAASSGDALLLIALDGDTQHGLIASELRRANADGSIGPVLLASIGYGADLLTVTRLRAFDYTPYSEANPNGRVDAFWRFVIAELLPGLEARYFGGAALEPGRVAVAGHSYGGLAVAYALLHDWTRARIRRFLAISPSLHFGSYEAFGWEEALAEGLPSEGEGASAYIAWGGAEPKAMGLLAQEMAQRLGAREGLRLDSREFPFAEHLSVVGPAYAGGLDYLFAEGGP